MCLDRHTRNIKGFKVNVVAFEELCFSPSGPPLLVSLPHFLTLVFSSSPFFRLPQSLEFAAGQKAAAEAQPIWSAAPPFWRSKREEGTRLVVNQDAKSTSCLYAQPTYSACLDLLHTNWQQMPHACLIASYKTFTSKLMWHCMSASCEMAVSCA